MIGIHPSKKKGVYRLDNIPLTTDPSNRDRKYLDRSIRNKEAFLLDNEVERRIIRRYMSPDMQQQLLRKYGGIITTNLMHPQKEDPRADPEMLIPTLEKYGLETYARFARLTKRERVRMPGWFRDAIFLAGAQFVVQNYGVDTVMSSTHRMARTVLNAMWPFLNEEQLERRRMLAAKIEKQSKQPGRLADEAIEYLREVGVSWEPILEEARPQISLGISLVMLYDKLIKDKELLRLAREQESFVREFITALGKPHNLPVQEVTPMLARRIWMGKFTSGIPGDADIMDPIKDDQLGFHRHPWFAMNASDEWQPDIQGLVTSQADERASMSQWARVPRGYQYLEMPGGAIIKRVPIVAVTMVNSGKLSKAMLAAIDNKPMNMKVSEAITFSTQFQRTSGRVLGDYEMFFDRKASEPYLNKSSIGLPMKQLISVNEKDYWNNIPTPISHNLLVRSYAMHIMDIMQQFLDEAEVPESAQVNPVAMIQDPPKRGIYG